MARGSEPTTILKGTLDVLVLKALSQARCTGSRSRNGWSGRLQSRWGWMTRRWAKHTTRCS
jgi:hypothetical protein